MWVCVSVSEVSFFIHTAFSWHVWHRHGCCSVGRLLWAQARGYWLLTCAAIRPHVATDCHLNWFHLRNTCKYMDYNLFTDFWEMEGWVGLAGWPTADCLPTNWHLSTIDLSLSENAYPQKTDVLTTELCCQPNLMIVYIQSRELSATSENRLSVEVNDVPSYSNCNVTVAAKHSNSLLWGEDVLIRFETPPQGTLINNFY